MKSFLRLFALWLALLFLLPGCQTAYYGVMEKFGYEKRDLLKSAVEKARNGQEEAAQEFKDALTRLKEMYAFDGGDLEKTYSRLKSDYDDCDSKAGAVRKRIKDMDEVAYDLFAEWEKEIGQMSNQALASDSRGKLAETKSKFSSLSSALHQAEASMEPVLKNFSDHVLYLKHNLNAAAIGSLKGEAANIQAEVNRLIKQMNSSIEQADEFIQTLK